MIKYRVLYFFVCLTLNLSAQDKHDYVWIMGYDGNDSIKKFGGTRIDFNSNPAHLSFFNLPDSFDFEAPCSMADENGHLEFYVNGCRMINAQHKMLENGYGFNPGWNQKYECDYFNFGYGGYEDYIVLPRPEHPRHYYYFHFGVDEAYDVITKYYSEVDMNANDGAGKVILKNQVLWEYDSIAWTASAVRHGNGRDWWLTLAERAHNIYRLFLVTPDTIEGPFIRNMDQSNAQPMEIGWNTNFSPDGRKFVRTAFTDPPALFLYDFDRCSGNFSNPQRINFPVPEGKHPWAVFSPNSRYLYLQLGYYYLYQFDLEAPDIAASALLIDTFDGFKDEHGFPTTFHQMALAPDGKIYFSTAQGSYYMHTIHAPDERGQSCDFRQHDLVMPTYNLEVLPVYPNYRLGKISDNPCAPVEDGACYHLKLLPNPVSDVLRLQFDKAYSGEIRFVDMAGRLILQASVTDQTWQELSVRGLPNGIYAVLLDCPEKGRFEAVKCAVMH